MLFLCKMETTHKAKVRSVMMLRLLTQWEAVICAWITAAIWRAHKHLWPPPWLETITGILSSYCISVVKTRNDNFHACICSPSVAAYVSFDRSLLQTLRWSQSILTKTHLTVQWICLLRHPIKQQVPSSYLSSLCPYILFFTPHYVIECQRMMNWEDKLSNVWHT